MSVGGLVLEIRHCKFPEGTRPVVRLWIICTNAGGPGVHDEVFQYVEPQADLPEVGEGVWWQGRSVFFDRDRKSLKRVGYTHEVGGGR